MERKNLKHCGPVTVYRNIGGTLALVATIKPDTARAEARAIADRAERVIRAKARRAARKAKQAERVRPLSARFDIVAQLSAPLVRS